MKTKQPQLKISVSELHGFLEGIAWRLVGIAVRHQDNELLEIYFLLQHFIDESVIGKCIK